MYNLAIYVKITGCLTITAVKFQDIFIIPKEITTPIGTLVVTYHPLLPLSLITNIQISVYLSEFSGHFM